MLGRLLASIRKEILVFLRDPKVRGMLFGLPVMQVLVFGFAATLEVRHVDLAIVNDDAGRWSREMISRASAASFVGRVVHLDSMEEFSARLARREVLLGLHFPADFSRDVALGRPANVQVVIDGRRANAGQVAFSYMTVIAAGLGLELAGAEPQDLRQVILDHYCAREPGYRTKVAVASTDQRVDCVGACVGVRGNRIKNIVDELGGERRAGGPLQERSSRRLHASSSVSSLFEKVNRSRSSPPAW